MKRIITRIYEILKETNNLIEFEEQVQLLMYDKKGIENNTIRKVYLASQQRSYRKQREVKKMVRVSELLLQPTRPSIGVKHGSINLYSAHLSAIGRLFKVIS